MSAAAPLLLLATALAQATPPAATPPWSIEGRLVVGGALVESPDGYGPHLYADHRLRLEAGRRYRFSAHSDFGGTGFDPVLELRDQAGGAPLALNNNVDALANDGPESGDARFDFTPARSGDYLVRVRTAYQDEQGAYQARAEALPPLPAPVEDPPAATEPLGWRVLEGELREGDAEAFENYYDDFAVPMRAGELRIVTVAPLGPVAPADEEIRELLFDVRVIDPEAPAEELEMAAPGPHILAFRAPRDGTFLVRVSASDRTGRYQLRISENR
jgi:hypothetical protein